MQFSISKVYFIILINNLRQEVLELLEKNDTEEINQIRNELKQLLITVSKSTEVGVRIKNASDEELSMMASIDLLSYNTEKGLESEFNQFVQFLIKLSEIKEKMVTE